MGAHVIAVDMQPMCVSATACNLKVNNVTADVHLAYVAPDHMLHSIRVPDDDCNVMASPTAVAGRFPHGLMQKKSRVIYGTDNRTFILSPTMQMVRVPPLHIGSYLSNKRKVGTVSVVKIDTEGFEISVIEALRPIWHMLDNVILEIQPRSWHFANVTLEHGLTTLHDLMKAQGFEVVTMPHADRKTNASMVAEWTACSVQLATDPQAFVPVNVNGIENSRRFGFRGLKHYVNSLYKDPARHGWFSEILLTRTCSSRHEGSEAHSYSLRQNTG